MPPEIGLDQIPINSLDLSFNDIVFSEPTFLKIKDALKCSQLLELNLSGNKIGPKGFYQIANGLNQISELKSLMLSKCGMKIGACYNINSVMSRNCTLKQLDLSHNKLFGGHNPKSFYNMISSNKCLEVLNFNESMLGDSSLSNIARGFRPIS